MNNSHNNEALPHTQANSNEELVARWGRAVIGALPYEPNQEQMTLIAAMAHFLWRGDERSVMLLGGYAGTGKTSMMGAMVRVLSEWGIKVLLLAPTGRAAKVLAENAGHAAFTIHRKIYRQGSYPEGAFTLNDNLHTRTLVVVDEASMVANDSSMSSIFGPRSAARRPHSMDL